MKDLGKIKPCLDFQVEQLSKRIFVHQSSYIEKILKQFLMDKTSWVHPRLFAHLKRKKDPFHPRENGEELIGLEVPYLSAISALMYLANRTHLDIAFSVGKT